MKASEDIFRAYDIRGVYGKELDAEIGTCHETDGHETGEADEEQYRGMKNYVCGETAEINLPRSRPRDLQ